MLIGIFLSSEPESTGTTAPLLPCKEGPSASVAIDEHPLDQSQCSQRGQRA
jgi:hypothetical protein